MKILHSGDWHLDSPLQGHSASLADSLLSIPEQICDLCKAESCDLVLLTGDLFDGPYTKKSYRALYTACEKMGVPVMIAPGNHDPLTPDSPYLTESWPDNVHIFTEPRITSVFLPSLNARIYGAGYTGMDCPALLTDFRAEDDAQYRIGVLHGDPMTKHSPYCPITQKQVADSGLTYLALGHIHKADHFVAGSTLCAWPGCPMGRGYDESGEKGVYLVELGSRTDLRFISLRTPRFYDLQAEVVTDPLTALCALLPPVSTQDLYRITLTGHSEAPDLPRLRQQFSHLPNLELRDRTVPPLDIWKDLGQDTFAGMVFTILRNRLETGTEEEKEAILLAARLSRQILDGEEVRLP